MKQIFTWGYEAPLTNDYTKDTATIANKIRKTARPNLSEQHDNYRTPQSFDDQQLLFNYFDHEEQELWKRKFLELAKDKENLQMNKSTYQQFFNQAEMK